MQEDFLVFIKTIFTFNKSLRHLCMEKFDRIQLS